MGCCTHTVETDLGDNNPIAKMKKRLWRVRNCGIGWMGISILFFIVGIILLVFFAKDISGDTAKRGVGITGVAFFLIGFLGLVFGIGIIVAFCMAFKRSQDRMSGRPVAMTGDAHKQQFPDGLYPKQKGFVYPGQQQPGQQPAQPTAPDTPANQGQGQDNKAVSPDEIIVTPTEKY